MGLSIQVVKTQTKHQKCKPHNGVTGKLEGSPMSLSFILWELSVFLQHVVPVLPASYYVSPSVGQAKASDHLCQWAYRVGMMNILKRKHHSQKAN